MEIILASSSPYRILQLEQFGLEFRAIQPKVNEEALKSSRFSPQKLSTFLAFKKAESLSKEFPHDIIIGADQLVNLKGQILGKPGTREKAAEMLRKMSGKTHQLITSICLLHKGRRYEDTVVAKITLRRLTRNEILNYIYRDQPLDCAGSYKFEMSGYSLVKRMSVSDPSSLTGLPLISLMNLLLKIGEPIPFIHKRAVT